MGRRRGATTSLSPARSMGSGVCELAMESSTPERCHCDPISTRRGARAAERLPCRQEAGATGPRTSTVTWFLASSSAGSAGRR
jgi:hypothetical protein